MPDLPPLLLLTDSLRLPDPEGAIAGLPRGSGIILRHYDHPDRPVLAQRLRAASRERGLRLLVAGDARLAVAVRADGLHLPEALVRRTAGACRAWRRPGWLVTAAAHSPAALCRAAQAGADAALLSPVFATASHPGAQSLGAVRFARWCGESPIPVYALGGIDADSARRLTGSRCVGLAGIGAIKMGLFERDML